MFERLPRFAAEDQREPRARRRRCPSLSQCLPSREEAKRRAARAVGSRRRLATVMTWEYCLWIFNLNDFERIGKRTPVLADLRPSGNFLMSELIEIGGIVPLMKGMLEEGLIDGSQMTVTGKSLEENLSTCDTYPTNQEIIREVGNPIKPDSHLRILYGNLAPQGAVAKISGKEGLRFEGKAKVYDSEESAMQGILSNQVTEGDVLVIRYEGPRGAPGMREMLSPTSAIMGKGLGDKAAFQTDVDFQEVLMVLWWVTSHQKHSMEGQ